MRLTPTVATLALITALLLTPLVFASGRAHASGTFKVKPAPDQRFSFSGTGTPTKIRAPEHYIKLTVKYDHEVVVKDKRIDDRNPFGSHVTSKLSYDGKIWVKVSGYNEQGKLLKERSWYRKLEQGMNEFNLRGDSGHWAAYIHMNRTGTNVAVEIE